MVNCQSGVHAHAHTTRGQARLLLSVVLICILPIDSKTASQKVMFYLCERGQITRALNHVLVQ